MKKTQTKAFSNLIASIILLVFEIWAYVMTLDFKIVKKAAVQPATFPQIMCIGMMVFTVILLVQSILKLKKMDENGRYLKTPGGNPRPVTRPGYPETFRRQLIKQTGDRFLKPGQ